jgi:hypothetical protein
MRRALITLALALLAGAPTARRGEAAGQGVQATADARAQAQARVQERIMALLRERVGLSDDQLRRLAPVARSFTERRQALFRQERATRQALRQELSGAPTDQARVAAQIDTLLALQRRRLDLAAEEQRELAAFMTPAQRARYLALQEHLRRRAEELRRSRRLR